MITFLGDRVAKANRARREPAQHSRLIPGEMPANLGKTAFSAYI